MRQRHWKNWASNGEVAFVTATALDFAHVFGRDETKELVTACFLADCQRYDVPLFGFVVMSNHLHMLIQCPKERHISWLVQRVKSNLAKLVLPLLNEHELEQLKAQTGLGRRTLWQAGFRSLAVEGEATFDQKLDYIHQNPVRAGLCARAADYRWSSARLYEMPGLGSEHGLRLDLAIAEFGVPFDAVDLRSRLGS